MEHQIECPHCKRTIANNPVIIDAYKGAGSDTQFVMCECGERITYWQITAQLRDQQKLSRRFQNWVRSFSHSRSQP